MLSQAEKRSGGGEKAFLNWIESPQKNYCSLFFFFYLSPQESGLNPAETLCGNAEVWRPWKPERFCSGPALCVLSLLTLSTLWHQGWGAESLGGCGAAPPLREFVGTPGSPFDPRLHRSVLKARFQPDLVLIRSIRRGFSCHVSKQKSGCSSDPLRSGGRKGVERRRERGGKMRGWKIRRRDSRAEETGRNGGGGERTFQCRQERVHTFCVPAGPSFLLQHLNHALSDTRSCSRENNP